MSFTQPRFLGIGGALLLAIWLTTAISSPAQTLTTLANFDGTDGANPQAELAQGRGGNFYGTTPFGGPNNPACYGSTCGTVFRITPMRRLTTLHRFGSTDGTWPSTGLVLATDGNFYGTTEFGGANEICWNGCGTIFKITPGGTLTTLYNLCSQPGCTDGRNPDGTLVQATDGSLYGTTNLGGANSCQVWGSCGSVFKITPRGTLTTLHSFAGSDGAGPSGKLIQATDGDFYGTTQGGGASGSGCNGFGCGTVFKMTRAGKLTTLYSFCSQTSCTDGALPQAGLVQAADGNFYGTTQGGGANGRGTVFKITSAGALTTLYSFCSQTNCTDGGMPQAGLVQATDGNLYGTTKWGGDNSSCDGGPCGTVFMITLAGRLTTLYDFCSQTGCIDGAFPVAALLQGTSGNFYGTTSWAGAHGDGTIFSLSRDLGPFVTFVRDSGKAGSKAEILGQGLTGTTAVSFNGTAANFVVHSDTYLTATVPQGATTGFVTVTTPGAVLQSNVKFRVRK
jgi:uncharacterized repeat protein (TIGR03803 family)